MTKPFDMEVFLSGVLNGSKVTQQRHLRQARVMQAAIEQRWQRQNPWTWQLKHIRWFLTQHLKNRSNATRYYYQLTSQLIRVRLAADIRTDKTDGNGNRGGAFERAIADAPPRLAAIEEDIEGGGNQRIPSPSRWTSSASRESSEFQAEPSYGYAWYGTPARGTYLISAQRFYKRRNR